MKPHLKVPRGGDLSAAPLRCRALAVRCSFSLRAATITFRAVLWGSPFHSHALELVVWFIRSGEGPSLVFKLFYMNTLHLFPLWWCSCWSDLLCSAVSVEETLWVWCWVNDLGSQASQRRMGAMFEYSHRLSFQEESLWGSNPGPSVSLSVGLCTRHRCAGGCWLTDLLFVLLEWAFVVLPGGFLVL